MERIDKIIASQGLYSRSDVKYLVKHKRVAVDGETVTSSSKGETAWKELIKS